MTTDLAVLDQSVRNWLTNSGLVAAPEHWKHHAEDTRRMRRWLQLNHDRWIRAEYRRLLAERGKPQGPMTSAGMPTWRTGGP